MKYCECCGQPMDNIIPENIKSDKYAFTIKNSEKVYLSSGEFEEKVKKNKEKVKENKEVKKVKK